jgi:hypothetical protein
MSTLEHVLPLIRAGCVYSARRERVPGWKRDDLVDEAVAECVIGLLELRPEKSSIDQAAIIEEAQRISRNFYARRLRQDQKFAIRIPPELTN